MFCAGIPISLQLDEIRLSMSSERFDVIMLRFGKGQKQKRIAEELGISQPRVSQQLAAARQQYPHLRRLLTNGRHRSIRLTENARTVAPHDTPDAA